jgi:uncharacterized repeat protein (TIGR01451 family)
MLLAWAALLVPAVAQTSSPSPSASGSPAPSPSGSVTASPSPSGAAEREGLALLVSAEPDTIDVGDETVLVAQVSNTGTTTIDAASVEVDLPEELELITSFPAPASTSGNSHAFDLGSLDPGESAVAQITARGDAPVAGAVVAASATGGATTAADSTTVSVVEGGGVGTLTVSSRTRSVLAQVGDMVHYEVTVSNEGDEDLENVLVVDVAPQEIDVFSVDIVDEVEAVQIGESGGRHDIVWNVGSLPAGTSVRLPWDGRAAQAGDLRAVNSVRGLVGTTETTRSTSESFLGAEGARDVENPPFEPIEKKIVTFEDPGTAGEVAQRAATQPGVVLPFTGTSVSSLLLAAVLLVFGGLLLLVGAQLVAPESRKAVAAAILAGLIGAACVSSGDDPAGDAAPQASPRVKGERIVRGESPEPEAETPVPATPPPSPTATATAAPTAPPTTTTPPPVVAAPPTAPVPVDPAPVRVVRVVTTELEDLPVETQESRDGDNTISFGWDEAAGGVTSASSGTRFVRGSGSELLTDLSSNGGAIVNRLTLRNTREAARLSVEGRLVHEVYSGSTLVARLRSEPVDVVLAPGGAVVARFSYLLPAGDYVVQTSFEASQ